MYKYVGYVWPGMLRVSVTEAKKLLRRGAAVYRLHLDNTESAVTEVSEIVKDGEYGVECKEFSFAQYLASNQDDSGAVVFSHGTDSVDDLLVLMKEFLECIRPSLRVALQEALDMIVRRIDKYADSDDMQTKECVWRCAETFLNGVTPMGWKFGAFANNGLDYVFIKEERVTA